MIIFKHEIRRGRKALLIWSTAIGITILICLLLFPELKQQVAPIQAMIQNLGSLSAVFGMDRLNFGEIMGFYAIYANYMLGIGGMFYAALLGCGMLSKEEQEHTAETLLSYPVSRYSVCFWKYAAVLAQIMLMNVLIAFVSALCMLCIKEVPEWGLFLLYHLAQVVMQMEIASVCYGVSAFLRKGGNAVGMGIAFVLYVLGLISNISEQARVLKYITPYAYADGASIIPNASLDGMLIGLGLVYALIGLAVAFWKYGGKDIYN